MKHEEKICARCGRTFECKANNALRCDCARVDLDDATLHALRELYPDCLCLSCLRDIAAGDRPTLYSV